MSTISTYMGFPISTIGTDSGLDWETNLNAALSIIDQHNHSPGMGQQIQPSGLDISTDLSFQSNNATDLRTARFVPQLSPIANVGSDKGEIYVSGNELWYNDINGNQTQITLNGTVNATSSGISSGTATASFSGGSLIVKSSSTSYANVDLLSVVLSNSGNLVNQLTLNAPVLSGSYSLSLPYVPAATSFMTIDPSGNMASTIPVALGITDSNIANTTITNDKFAVGTQIPLSNTSKTANYTALTTDASISCDSSGGIFTITIYNAPSNPGLELEIDKTSTDFNAVTITDGAGFTTTINTKGECVSLLSTSGGWKILNRYIPSVWASLPNSITATTTNPTKASIPLTDHFWYRRVGEDLEFRMEYSHSNTATGNTDGTGDYLFNIPPGISIDLTKVTANTTIGASNTMFSVGYAAALEVGAGFETPGYMFVYNGAAMRMLLIIPGSLLTPVSSTEAHLGSSPLTYTAIGSVPISGWNS